MYLQFGVPVGESLLAVLLGFFLAFISIQSAAETGIPMMVIKERQTINTVKISIQLVPSPKCRKWFLQGSQKKTWGSNKRQIFQLVSSLQPLLIKVATWYYIIMLRSHDVHGRKLGQWFENRTLDRREPEITVHRSTCWIGIFCSSWSRILGALHQSISVHVD